MKRNIFCAVLITIFSICIMQVPVGAWSASNLLWLGLDGDNWYNYDFRNWDMQSDDVDWPVTQIYWGNASVASIKQILWGDASLDSDMRLLVQDDNTYTFDTDLGSKGGQTWPNGYHVRLYASNNGTRSYCATLGWYVLGTTHRDDWPDFGWSESASFYVYTKIAETLGWNNISFDQTNMYNYEAYRVVEEGGGFSNYIDCDGYVDLIYIP